MMLEYDDVAQELVVHLENGLPPFSLHVDELVVKCYTDEGVLSFVPSKEGADLHLNPISKRPCDLSLTANGERRWRLRFVHKN